MVGYLVRRILTTLALLLAVPIVLFAMMQLAPGTAIDVLVGADGATPEYRQELERIYGLDQPLIIQFWNFFIRAITFNFGYSFGMAGNVSDLILQRVGPTLLIVLPALAIATIIGVVVGILSAMTKRKRLDSISVGTVLVTLAVPSFWVAQLLVLFFAIRLGWFPSSGMTSLRPPRGVGPVGDVLMHLVLPVLALVIVEFGATARVMRASTLEVLAHDYLTTAEMKGLSPRQIKWRHIIRNASLPVITIVGARFGRAIAGSLLIETVFGWPGMGSLLYAAVTSRENQVILGVTMVIAVCIVIVNLLTDLAYAIIDPRIRHAK